MRDRLGEIMRTLGRLVGAPLLAFTVLVAGSPAESGGAVATREQSQDYSLYLTSSPKPLELSKEEKEAVQNKKQGRPYDKEAYKRASKKQIEAEKYNKERNKPKRDGYIKGKVKGKSKI